MGALTDTIESCQGQDGCFGRVTGPINPIVFKYAKDKVRVMVITEQPRGNRSRKDDLKGVLSSGSKNSVPKRLVELFGNEFTESVISERGAFYWTHFIKCPGNFRDKRTGLVVNSCADLHLSEEIHTLKPALIVCVGGESSRWLLGLAGSSLDWRDCVMDQLCKNRAADLRLKLGKGAKDEFLETKVMLLFHPAERSGIGWHYDSKLKSLLRTTIVSLVR